MSEHGGLSRLPLVANRMTFSLSGITSIRQGDLVGLVNEIGG